MTARVGAILERERVVIWEIMSVEVGRREEVRTRGKEEEELTSSTARRRDSTLREGRRVGSEFRLRENGKVVEETELTKLCSSYPSASTSIPRPQARPTPILPPTLL